MKLRIVEDLIGIGSQRWFKLERWEPRGSTWYIIDSGFSLDKLTSRAETLRNQTDLELVLKEFDSDPPPESVEQPLQPLIDKPKPIA